MIHHVRSSALLFVAPLARRGLALALGLGAFGCSGGLSKFPLAQPMAVDLDKRPFTTMPEEYESSFLWDGADQMVFRPIAKFWKVDPGGEAVNVNAMDEVADSAWFTNRLGRYPMTLEEVRRGPCKGPPLDPAGPWTVTGAKPNGANPGIPIKAADGRRYMVKFDGIVQGPRSTAADVIASKIYYAAGYETPCNEIVHFDRAILRISPDAKSENEAGEKVPMGPSDLDKVFSKGIQLPDGRYRASASLFLKGKILGPFRYEGTRDDDPNDVVAHEDRRELRGAYVLAAWTNHFDHREQNTMDTWIEVPGKGGYVQHHILDLGDCFGSIWEPPNMGRRIGHSHYFAGDHVAVDFVTFGLIQRPWDENRFGPSGKVWAYYKVENYRADEWRPGYPNPAMLRMAEADGAWMARILASITPAHVEAMLAAGRIEDPILVKELKRIVLGRRHKTLARYLSRLSPLTAPAVARTAGGRAELCLEDRGVLGGAFPQLNRSYAARAWLGDDLVPASLAPVARLSRVCTTLPQARTATPKAPAYVIVDLFAWTGSQERRPARVHLYHLGGDDYRVVGLERPDDLDAPSAG